MKKEQIEQASVQYAQTFIEGSIKAAKSFIAGAEWRINSVWHTVPDIPIPNEWLLIEYKADGKIQVCISWIGLCEVDEEFHYDKIIRWAYLKDLFPTKEEDNQ